MQYNANSYFEFEGLGVLRIGDKIRTRFGEIYDVINIEANGDRHMVYPVCITTSRKRHCESFNKTSFRFWHNAKGGHSNLGFPTLGDIVEIIRK